MMETVLEEKIHALICAGRVEESISFLQEKRSLADPETHGEVANLIFQLILSERRWDDIVRLGLLADEAIDHTNRHVAAFYASRPAFSLDFSQDEETLPLHRTISGCASCDVRLNGQDLRFWVDTGAEMTVLAKSVAEQCKLPISIGSALSVENSTNQSFQTDLAWIDEFEIGAITVQNQAALVLDDSIVTLEHPITKESETIQGIIGWDILQHLCLTIDFHQNEVTFAKSIPTTERHQNLFFSGSPIVHLQAEDSIPLLFGLDTGANKSHFHKRILSKLPHLHVKTEKRVSGGLGDVAERNLNTLEELSLTLSNSTSLLLENIRETLGEFGEFISLDGILGVDAAKNKKLIIDYPNRTFSIE
ncbi:retropepsin-like aspartic protease [Paenisporosarcina cavernae]|uniref:Peptidase A2 domain-containing protein n=1 Tax=Paenisporosarcina cavernae TaxID=2320858 RepID=A0A385YRW7_9BACL|nr:retropepsin-like aspartic protease [Paenisporosarcina cavernae]AYC28488.1 hypothetical protein D3873_00870 [Paenisporosarcina cavernae]